MPVLELSIEFGCFQEFLDLLGSFLPGVTTDRASEFVDAGFVTSFVADQTGEVQVVTHLSGGPSKLSVQPDSPTLGAFFSLEFEVAEVHEFE